MWLASFRLAQVVAAEHPLMALRHELRLHRLCQEIVLDPFSERELADYIDRRFPDSEVSEAFVRALHARTDGLPLFVVNVIDDLIAQGILQPNAAEPPADAALVPLQVPESLAGVIEKQIARLTPDARTVLEAASVCGVEFRPETVADALEREASWAGEQCEELARQQQWLSAESVERLPDGALAARYAFRHALYRQVFYQRIGALTRAQLHRRVAQSMERSRAAGVAVTAAELASHYELSHDLLPALRYSAEAAENALRHFAPQEAMSLTAHALELLPRCPEATGRDSLELALTAMSGVAAALLLGVSSRETKRAFERAQALLEALPQHPLRGQVLHGLGLSLLVRGEYAESRALAERMHALFKVDGDHVLLFSACSLLGQINALQGSPHEACEWLEQGVVACDQIGDEALQAAFVVDPGVTIYAASVIPLLHLGLADQARTRLEATLARARRFGQPMAQMVACWFGALLEVRLGNPERVAALATALRAFVDDAALAQGEGPSRWFRGWAEARLGSPRAGYRLIRDAFDHNSRHGMFSGSTEVLGYAAEALILAEDWVAAQAELDQALQLAQKLTERVYMPQLLVLQGRIALAQGDIDAARASMQAALREARRQRALWLELTALVALCELDNAVPKDLSALKDARARLREGFDTALVMRADELLARANRQAD
jgi:tetratricopeptide (TPR) repeat protein